MSTQGPNGIPFVTLTDVNGTPLSIGGGGGGGAVTVADGSDVTQGAQADSRATWYTATASFIALCKLQVAIAVGAGSHAYGYDGSGNLLTDAWTLLGTTRTKTYTWVGSNMTAETDWV